MKIQSILASLILTVPALAGTPPMMPPPAPAATTTGEELWFRGVVYGWLTAIKGDIGIGPLSSPVDISMSDTLDTLDMAYMGLFEAGYGRFSVGMDVVYGKTSADTDAGGRIFDSFRFEQKQWLLTPFLAYRAVETGRYHMDVLAGARITILDATLTGRFVGKGEIAANRDTSWADPIIGIRGQADLSDKWFFRYNGDIGGFGVSSDLTWQAFAGFGYNCTENVSIGFGYRGLGIDYGKDKFSLDTVTHGPVIGVEMRF